MYIHTKGFFKPELAYVPFGTIGYVKTTDNEIRQCKCLGAKWVEGNEKIGNIPLYPQYEWKVAGIREHQFSKSVPSRLPHGIIYTTEEYAQRGSSATSYACAQKGELNPTAVFPIFNYLINKYGLKANNFKVFGSTYECLEIKTYTKNKDHTTSLRETDFEVFIDENGIDCRIPMLEGPVNGIRRYATAEKAYASMKPLKVYSLDDDEDDDILPTISRVKMTIEVEIEDIESIKKYATILG